MGNTMAIELTTQEIRVIALNAAVAYGAGWNQRLEADGFNGSDALRLAKRMEHYIESDVMFDKDGYVLEDTSARIST